MSFMNSENFLFQPSHTRDKFIIEFLGLLTSSQMRLERSNSNIFSHHFCLPTRVSQQMCDVLSVCYFPALWNLTNMYEFQAIHVSQFFFLKKTFYYASFDELFGFFLSRYINDGRECLSCLLSFPFHFVFRGT